METPEDSDEVIEVCKFPISDQLKISPKAEIELVKRYFTWTIDGHIYSLLRATFVGETLVKEEELGVPSGTQWKNTKTFSKAWLLGSDNYFMNEVDLSEIQTHLPAGVSA